MTATARPIVAALMAIGFAYAPAGTAVGAADTPSATIPTVPFTIAKETTVVTGPLKPDGTVDYVAAVNERLSKGVTAENNAFVLWVQLMGPDTIPAGVRQRMLSMSGAHTPTGEQPWAGYADGKHDGAEQKRLDDELDQVTTRLWTAQAHPGFAAFLKERQPLLTMATEASQRPHFWSPAVSPNGTLVNVLLPALSSMRSVSRTLAARSLLRVREGDFDGFLSDIMTVKRLARLVGGWTMVERIVAFSIESTANRAVGAAAGSGAFSADQCAQLTKALDALVPLPLAWEAVDVGERWHILEFVALVATGKTDLIMSTDRGFNQWVKSFERIDRASVDWDVVLKQANRTKDEMIAAMKEPLVDVDQAAWMQLRTRMAQAARGARGPLTKSAAETPEAYTQRIALRITAAATESLGPAIDWHRETLIQKDLTRAVVAAARYRAEKGTWPATLDDLTAGYLPAVPTDPYSPQGEDPVHHLQTERGILLYSVGRNRTDDGGQRDHRTSRDDIAVGIDPAIK